MTGREPVETTMRLPARSRSPACTVSGETKRASARTTSTPRSRMMPSWSPAYASCISWRQAMSRVQSTSGGSAETPMRAASRASSRVCAAT